MHQNNTYVAIMAGGIGSRFWPASRTKQPKQFLDVLGTGKTLIQTTYQRYTNFVPPENIYIVTGSMYKDLVKTQLPDISDQQIVAEPMRRNTGPCVAYISHKIAALNKKAVLIVAPSDHLITEEVQFIQVMEKAVHQARVQDSLITLGISPTRPHTGYGYIQYDEDTDSNRVFDVVTFTEKPSLDIAKEFLKSGDFLWNSGIFIWHVQTILEAFKLYQPDINELFTDRENRYNTEKEEAFIASAYSQCNNISIDYAIMENAQNVRVIPASFGWSDLGTWTSLWENSEKDYFGNVSNNDKTLIYDSENCLVYASNKDKLIIVQGLADCCVVDTDNALLICRMEDEQQIKKINQDIKEQFGNDFA